MEAYFSAFANFMWGTPMVILLVGGGLFLCSIQKGYLTGIFAQQYKSSVAAMIAMMMPAIFPMHRL